MKRLLILFLCALLLTGCSSHSSETEVSTEAVVSPVTESNSPDHTQMLSVSVPTTTEHFYADDGTELLYTVKQHMQLLLANDTVANRIILDFLNRVDAMHQDTEELLRAAQSVYRNDQYWNPYHQLVIYSPTRIDHGVLSLFGISSSYTGGIHGNQRAVSVSYDLSTGDVLTLASIMHLDAEKEDFIDLILDDLRKNAETYYLFDDYEETVRYILGGDETQYSDFYFTQTGLVFYFSPYDIAPYASGVITVEVPYSELTGILYNGYFPDERDEASGSILTGDFTAMDMSQFTCMEEITLNSEENLTVIYPDGKVSNVQIIISGDGITRPSYTVFAAHEMNEQTAVVLGADSMEFTQIHIRYDSSGSTNELNLQ